MRAGETAGGGDGRREVLVVTGSRSEFGLLEGTVEGLLRSPALRPAVAIAGMHLDADLGSTWREVEARFPVAARVPMSPPEDTPGGMAMAVAEGLAGFSRLLEERRPDALLVLGDRTEPFAAALAAAYQGIPIAHVHGGDVTGNPVDDLHRDAISRMAVLHLAATGSSRARLLALGVRGEVAVTGAPGLDRLLAVAPGGREDLSAELGIPPGPLLVVVQHPEPRRSDRAGRDAREVLAAAEAHAGRIGAFAVVLYPNNDAGHREVIAAIEERRAHPRFRLFPSLPRSAYIRLLSHARALVGNSSSAIIESVSLGLPAVNVGDRQAGRERNGNVLDAPPDRRAILRALDALETDPGVRAAVASRANVYGDGRAAERIVEALERFLAAGGAGGTR